MKYYQAQDTFVAELEDGGGARVVKGEVLPENHELVQRDLAATSTLFKAMDTGDGDDGAKPARSPRRAAKTGA